MAWRSRRPGPLESQQARGKSSGSPGGGWRWALSGGLLSSGLLVWCDQVDLGDGHSDPRSPATVLIPTAGAASPGDEVTAVTALGCSAAAAVTSLGVRAAGDLELRAPQAPALKAGHLAQGGGACPEVRSWWATGQGLSRCQARLASDSWGSGDSVAFVALHLTSTGAPCWRFGE